MSSEKHKSMFDTSNSSLNVSLSSEGNTKHFPQVYKVHSAAGDGSLDNWHIAAAGQGRGNFDQGPEHKFLLLPGVTKPVIANSDSGENNQWDFVCLF